MTYEYKGHYKYDYPVIRDWDSSEIGVYYCGFITAKGGLRPLYIGQGAGDDGMRGRLLDHIREEEWPDVTHFGFHFCDTPTETESLEAEEIAKYKPKYNKLGK